MLRRTLSLFSSTRIIQARFHPTDAHWMEQDHKAIKALRAEVKALELKLFGTRNLIAAINDHLKENKITLPGTTLQQSIDGEMKVHRQTKEEEHILLIEAKQKELAERKDFLKFTEERHKYTSEKVNLLKQQIQISEKSIEVLNREIESLQFDDQLDDEEHVNSSPALARFGSRKDL